MARKARTQPRKPSSTRTRRGGDQAEGSEQGLPSPSDVLDAFRRASPAQRALMIAGGLVVLGTSPYWGPVMWRSKRVRSLVATGAGFAFDRFLG